MFYIFHTLIYLVHMSREYHNFTNKALRLKPTLHYVLAQRVFILIINEPV